MLRITLSPLDCHTGIGVGHASGLLRPLPVHVFEVIQPTQFFMCYYYSRIVAYRNSLTSQNCFCISFLCVTLYHRSDHSGRASIILLALLVNRPDLVEVADRIVDAAEALVDALVTLHMLRDL